MSIFNAESLSIWPERLRTNRGNGYLLPGAIANPRSASEGEVFPNHDCARTGSTRPGGEVLLSNPTPDPDFNDSQEGGYYPLSNQISPDQPATTAALPDFLGDLFPAELPFPNPLLIPADGSMAAFATCTLQENSVGFFPAAFGGGRIPHILPDP
jgi:hypothetical protein